MSETGQAVKLSAPGAREFIKTKFGKEGNRKDMIFSREEEEATNKLKTSILRAMIGVYAILGGAAFFLIQTMKILKPSLAKTEISQFPLGRFDWGFIWSDTLVPGPLLLIGGILLLVRDRTARRLGQLFAFAGFAINLYAMIILWIGLAAVGQPMGGAMLWLNMILTGLGALCMVFLCTGAAREEQKTQRSA